MPESAASSCRACAQLAAHGFGIACRTCAPDAPAGLEHHLDALLCVIAWESIFGSIDGHKAQAKIAVLRAAGATFDGRSRRR
jgi:hypothetical protein